MPPSKFEVNPMLHLRVRRASFLLESLCSNDYYRAYAIIDFLTNRLVFPNMVTYINYEICDRIWEKVHYGAYFQNRAIGTTR